MNFQVGEQHTSMIPPFKMNAKLSRLLRLNFEFSLWNILPRREVTVFEICRKKVSFISF